MAAISQIVNRVAPQRSSADRPDLTFGLPLETGAKTIYPVFQESRNGSADDGHLKQIGYLELTDNGSDFTSLETGRRLPVALMMLGILTLVLAWAVRRRAFGDRN